MSNEKKDGPLKIVELTAENVKKLRAIRITPGGGVVTVTGRNGQGKTSVLDAIWWALEGASHIQAVPIRRGEESARIRLDLGELVVERRFTDKGSALVVENAEGARYKSPQGMLDALLGALSFDPLAFVGQDAATQFDTLRKIVPLEVDVDQLDGKNRAAFEQRTELNREAKRLHAQAEGIVVPENLPAEKVDTAPLFARMKENGEIQTERTRREREAEAIGRRKRNAESLREEAAQHRQELAEIEAKADEIERESAAALAALDGLAPLGEMVDPDTIAKQLDAAHETNRQIENRGRREATLAEAGVLEGSAVALTKAIEERTAEKAAAIAKAPMPVEGLGFGDRVVTFNGVPFDQASTAEQLRVSVGIAMAANPRLRVLLVREGSLLDEEGLALIASMATEHDYQVWIERVDASGKIGIVIEDGQVVAVDGEPTAPVQA